MENRQFMRLVDKALTSLALDWPFWASIGLTMGRVVDTRVPVAATDGKEIVLNPDGFMAFEEDYQRTFVLLHEVTHVILKHPVLKAEMRMALCDDFDEMTFQYAADYVVNAMLVEAGVNPAPGVLLRHEFSGMSVEEVYMKIREEQKQEKPKPNPKGGRSGKGDGKSPEPQSGSGSPGDNDQKNQPFAGDYGQVQDLKLDEGETADSYNADLNQRLVQAENIAKSAGSMPGNFMSRIETMIRPTLDWRNIFAQVMFNQVPFEYSYKHPNKLFLQDDIVMPTITSGEGGDVVLAVDSSGSISDTDLQRMMSQFLGLRQAFPKVTMRLVFCDTIIHKQLTIKPEDDVDILMRMDIGGRGGTYFDPVFAWVRDNVVDPKVVVYLTDGWPFKVPDLAGVSCPIIWVLTADNDNWRKQCPRGEITLLDT